jgi:hypothetical protein
MQDTMKGLCCEQVRQLRFFAPGRMHDESRSAADSSEDELVGPP